MRKSEIAEGALGISDDLSPLTPALSPGEREPRIPSLGKSMHFGWHERLATIPPLPEGEGRGEGERRPAFHRARNLIRTLLFTITLLVFSHAFAEQRFPPPEFESGYTLPQTHTPAARALWLQYADVGMLAVALGVACYLIYRRRSRKGLVALSIFSLAYFGFYRNGCVCAIGSVQNVALALGNNGYSVPLTILGFFVLPLVVALFAGRAFCAGVCPHGALQDLLLIKPIKVPPWLEQGLSIVPFLYLGAAVLFAVTGSTFLICRYDPFVPLFRFGGSFLLLGIGAAFVLASLFVGRPYCRFVCPYGALLRITSLASKWRVTVTPTVCTQCRLCEQSCPFGALREPQIAAPAPATLALDRRRLTKLLVALPLVILACGWLGSRLSVAFSQVNPTVGLAERVPGSRPVMVQPGIQNSSELALARAQRDPKEMLSRAVEIRRRFAVGGWAFGGFVGLVMGIKLIGLSLHARRTDYEPDRGACFACARCFMSCPSEHARRGLVTSLPASAASANITVSSPSPQPSPLGRGGPVIQSLSQITPRILSEERNSILPLPRGEGRGEGEQHSGKPVRFRYATPLLKVGLAVIRGPQKWQVPWPLRGAVWTPAPAINSTSRTSEGGASA